MPSEFCETCNQPIGWRRFMGATLCGDCSARQKAERRAALAEYESLAFAVGNPSSDPPTIGRNLPAIAERAALDPKRARDLNWKALLHAFERSLADEIITRHEEERLQLIASSLGFTPTELEEAIARYKEPLFIARVNDGRLPTLADPGIILKKGEVAHFRTGADMLKEVLVREYSGGSRGMSFRIMKGVSYRVGSHRGQMQVVGSRLEVASSGVLTITSQRAVFTGDRKSQEVRYDKLLDVNVYTDAIQFHVSNRQNPSMFRVESGPMVAAAVNAAAQKSLE